MIPPLRPPETRQATIADVARMAGVAKSTVSNFLNGTAPVSDAIRVKVSAAIAALDYHPAEIARSFTSRRRAARGVDRFGPEVPCLTVVGYVSVDYIARLPHLPAREDRLLAGEIVKAIGGPGANVAAIAAGVGGEWTLSCSLITHVGIDQDSDWAVSELADRGVDIITPRERRQGRLSRALVLVEPDGKRTIIAEPLSVGQVDLREFIEATDTGGRIWGLHLEGFQVPGLAGHMHAARARGFKSSMHATGLPRDWIASHSEAMLSQFDVVVLQREKLAAMPGCPPATDAAIDWLAARATDPALPFPEALIVSLGARGAALITREGRIVRAPALVVEVIDETGAGDALIGAFLACWLNGASPELAITQACVAAGLALTTIGAQEMRPGADLLARYLIPGAAATARAELSLLHPQE